jgi:hypothetical protein
LIGALGTALIVGLALVVELLLADAGGTAVLESGAPSDGLVAGEPLDLSRW